MQINPLKKLYQDFLVILKDSVIKYRASAEKYEDIEMKKDADSYIRASRYEDTFNTYYRYDIDLISYVTGITDSEILEEYHLNRSKIPNDVRPTLLKMQREKIVNNYVEKNNYYRMLNGLPDYGETLEDFIYVDSEIEEKYGISTLTPIHLLSENEISILETIGYVDELLERFPTKKYLNYIGAKKIDIITSRTAPDFAVLYIPRGITDTLWGSFSIIYEQCREYFMSCIYINEYRSIIDYYDNFIAMCIMFMSIQQLISRVMKNTLERDFYDSYCIKLLFDVYGVPYNQHMDDATLTLIVQNLNLLVQNKATNKVIFDIASIFGYDRLKVYKYYLMKAQKFNAQGLPVVATKVDPTTGETVPDYSTMYDMYFQRVSLKDIDSYKAIFDYSNKATYSEITKDDPYWIDDEDLMKEMYESEYNYVETKYMGVSISYRMSRIILENLYLLKMILDKKEEIPSIKLDLPKLDTENLISLFDSIVIMCAIICKKYHLRGEILTTPSKILHVMGFNFEVDFDVIKQDILSNDKIDNSLVKYFDVTSTYSADGVNRLYVNIKNLYYDLVELMSSTQDIEAYAAYKKLYQTLFYADESRKMFNIGTAASPIYANTYMEYIEAVNPKIAEFINTIDEEELYIYITHISNKIMAFIPDLKYLSAFAGSSETVEEMLVQLISFFKSYTTDMIGFDSLYIFDFKPETLIKLIDHVSLHVNLKLKSDFNISYSDNIVFLSSVKYFTELLMMDRLYSLTANINTPDSLKYEDWLAITSAKIKSKEISSYYDVMSNISKKNRFDDSMKLQDKCFISWI